MTELNEKPLIGYMCSYVPYKYLSDLGFSLLDLNELQNTEKHGTTRLPVNLCSYALHCAKLIDSLKLDGIIITNCCNSMQRLYDYITLERPELFCHMLELPRKSIEYENSYFGQNSIELGEKLCSYFGHQWKKPHRLEKLISEDSNFELENNREICILGNAIPVKIREELTSYFKNYSLTINHCGTRSNGDILLQKYLIYKENETLMEYKYSEIPCTRMNHFISWFTNYIRNNRRLKGIVCFSSLNCDSFLFSFPIIRELCKEYKIPVIELEENYMDKSSGQLATRLEAFIECLEFDNLKTGDINRLKTENSNNIFVQRMKLVRAIIPKLKLKAVQKVVENQIDIFTNKLWSEPEKIVWTNMVMTPELFYAAGLTPINMELVAGWLSSLGLSREYISQSEGVGLSSSLCSYHKATLGLIETGGLSRPMGAAVSSHICDGGVGVANIFKCKYGTDTFILNIPFKKKPLSKEYLIKQYKDLIIWIENYTGRKLSEEKIKEALILSNETRKYWLQTLELRKGEPKIPGYLILRNLFGATFLFGSEFGYQVVRDYYSEMKRMAEIDSGNISPKSIKRILWIHFAPLYNNKIMEYFERELGCYIVYDITGHIYWPEYDVDKPLESLAERAVSHFYLGEPDERKKLYKGIIGDYKIDGIIHMMHNGCRSIPGASWQVRDIADESGIPYLEISGDCIDPRGFSEEQMKLRLEAFKETIWGR